jgi:hypothetical protein
MNNLASLTSTITKEISTTKELRHLKNSELDLHIKSLAQHERELLTQVLQVIKEIDKKEVRNLIDFGKAVKAAMKECNFTVGTYEPADPGDPVGWGVNFHFVGCKRD